MAQAEAAGWNVVLLSCAILFSQLACQDNNRSAGGSHILTDIPTLALADDPVTIGVAKGEEPYLFSAVSDASRQSDGTIVVADCASSELRYFDPSGRYIRTVER